MSKVISFESYRPDRQRDTRNWPIPLPGLLINIFVVRLAKVNSESETESESGFFPWWRASAMTRWRRACCLCRSTTVSASGNCCSLQSASHCNNVRSPANHHHHHHHHVGLVCGWRLGLVVARWSRSTKLLHPRPG